MNVFFFFFLYYCCKDIFLQFGRVPKSVSGLRRVSIRCNKYNLFWFFRLIHLFLVKCDVSGEDFSPYSGSSSLFCGMSRVAGWWLLRKITKNGSLFYLGIFEKVLRELEKHLWQGPFCKSCEITNHSWLKLKFSKDALLEIWHRCWVQH